MWWKSNVFIRNIGTYHCRRQSLMTLTSCSPEGWEKRFWKLSNRKIRKRQENLEKLRLLRTPSGLRQAFSHEIRHVFIVIQWHIVHWITMKTCVPYPEWKSCRTGVCKICIHDLVQWACLEQKCGYTYLPCPQSGAGFYIASVSSSSSSFFFFFFLSTSLFLLQLTCYGHETHAYSLARRPLQKLRV